MILLQTRDISKSFAARTILSGLSIEIKEGERVALVGRNGAGKSTLLKIIAGVMSADSGEVIFPKDKTMGYLPQNATLNSERTIDDEMRSVFAGLIDTERRLRNMEEKMANPDRFPDRAEYERLLQSYDALQASFKTDGGYTYQAEIKSVLNGLDFGDYPESMPVNNLSGGQKTRLALGKLLLIKPDLLVLDEPTNHLDIDTLTWLENYLQHYKGSVLVVSHDRYFLDRTVTKVYEVAGHTVHKYNGNYTRYLELKAAEYARQLKNYEKQQKEVAHLSEFIQKNIVRAATTKRAQSRRRQLEKMERIEKPKGDEKTARFSFTVAKESGRDVLDVSDLSIGYTPGAPLISSLNFRLSRGERVALVGPNGIGKSTLLKSIVNATTRLSGNVRFGSQVTVGYYDQEQSHLTDEKSVLSELWDEDPLLPENEIRNILGLFLFSGDDVTKTVRQLSGGEKARLMLAKLMMHHDNLLILDEPTNHLDLDSKEVLEAALADYSGTVFFVSHDRYFINRIATRVLELSRTGLISYLGDYDYYLDKKAENEAIAELEATQTEQKKKETPADGKAHFLKDKERKKQRRRLERSIAQLEDEIARLEDETDQLEKSLLEPEIFNDTQKANDVQSRLRDKQKTLETNMEKWEALQQSLEALEQQD